MKASLRHGQRRRLFAVAALALLAAAQGCGEPASTGPTRPPDVTITILGSDTVKSFLPNPALVKAGQTVAWVNTDAITHTATSDTGAFDTSAIAPGTTSVAIAFPTPGTYFYHCSIHTTMVGTVQVQ